MRKFSVRSMVSGLATIALAWLASSGFSADAEKDADFKPIKEAELPKGFPTYTPVGTIEIKQYPAARLAQAKSNGDSGFWKLFLHIQTHNVAMTAPVQMEYRSDSQGKPKQASMAFFYGDPAVGTAGPAGSVEVLDVPATQVVSIGMRGADSRQRMESARKQIDEWLAAHPQYEVCGDLRLMGYNSPFIAADKQFFEVQLPVREAKK